MKLFPRSNSLTDATTLVIYFNYVLGLRVFEYPRGYPRSVLSLIYILIIYVLYSVSYFYIEAHNENFSSLKLEYVIYLIMGHIYHMTGLLKMIVGWWHSKQVAVCYKKIFEIDKTLRQLGLAVCYNEIYFTTIGVTIIWFLLLTMIITGFFLYYQTHIDVLNAIYSLYMPIFYLSINNSNAFEFYVFSRCLQIKFELINHYLREIIRNLSLQETKLGTFNLKNYTKLMNFVEQKNIPSIKVTSQWNQRIYSISNFILRKQSPITFQIESHVSSQLNIELQNKCRNGFCSNISTTKYKNHIHLLQITKQVHLELCKVSKLICSAFGIQIAWEILIILLSLIQLIYRFYCICTIGKLKMSLADTYWPMAVCLINLCKILFLSRTCKNAASEGNKIIELIHITYGCNADIDMQEEMQQFGIQLLQSPVIFCVFGLTMDNQVLSMILKTLTIYMVVVIQLSNSLESNKDIKTTHF